MEESSSSNVVKRLFTITVLGLIASLSQSQTAPGTPFKSGFEPNTTMGSMSGTPPSGGTQNITGTDNSTGFTWSPAIWGASSRIYLHLIPPQSGTDPFSAHFNNNLVTMTGHTGSSTQVLHMSMNGYPVGTCCEQDVLEANSFSQGIKSEYFRVWVRLPSTLATNFASDHNSFQMLWEWKTNNHLRTATNIFNSGGTIGGWEMQIDTRGRNCDGGGTTGGYIDPNTGATIFNCSQVWSDGFNTGVAVPLNQWFLYEIYNKRSVGNDGTTKMAINGQIIHEQIGPNYGLNLEEIANAYLMNMYGQASEEWWLDDIEIRDSLPTGCSAFPCGANETGSSTASAAVPFMTSPHGAIGQVGQAFSYQVAASPTATSYSAFNLPPGTSINTSTGLVSGTPNTAGRYAAVSIHVKNSFGETVHALVFQINSSPSSVPTLSSLTASSTTINAGQWTQLQWAQSGATTLTLVPGNINVTGQDPFPVNPSVTTTYTLTATNSAGSTSRTVTVTVNGSTSGYFVSSSGGLDTNPGTSSAAPWQSLGKVTSGPTGGYKPGDTISFKTGDTWTGTFNTQASGTGAAPIVYTSYGGGAKPIIDGGGAGTLMNINHNFITVTGLQFQNASTIINFAGMDGTTITNNTVLNATSHVFYAGFGIAGTTVITGNTITAQAGHAGGNNSIEVWADSRQGKSYTVSDNVIDRHLSNNPNANCIILAGASNTTIERNICRGGTQGPGVKPYQDPSSGANCTAGDPGTNNIKIRGNYVDNITTANNGDGELIEGEGCDTTNQQTNLEVSGNILLCVSGGVGVGSSDAIGAYHNSGYSIHNNVIIGGCQSGWPANQNPTTSPGMIRINAASTNVQVFNNTLIGNMPAGDTRPQHGIGYFPGSAGIAQNNILKNLDTGVLCSQCGAVSGDHNLFDTDVVHPYSSGITNNGNNITASPQFVGSTLTTANDVKLQSTSPAIGSGAALATGFKFILDPAGTGPFLYSSTFDQSSAWMRGAFGFSGAAPPVISSFAANPTSISSGGSSQLTCTASNFTSLSISPGVGNVASGVPATVSPAATTQYDCTATNAASHVDAFATVTVNAPPPVITSYTANPVAIITGQSSTLQWTTTGATTCSINQGIGPVGCSSSRVVSPTVTTIYTLTATNSASVSVTSPKTVAVNVPTAIRGAVMQGAIIP